MVKIAAILPGLLRAATACIGKHVDLCILRRLYPLVANPMKHVVRSGWIVRTHMQVDAGHRELRIDVQLQIGG
ncbi:hypothetical protein [Mesorhizobium loti]|uniref:hypothetical protein n=1 Tax=Rhizobium loti TaxID=381 RepID=UPI001C011038|nr:hypothetical protein [Mesorhizobium loti]